MTRRAKYSTYFIVFMLFGWGLSLGCNKLTKGFRAANITSLSSFDPRWEPIGDSILENSSEIQRVLSSPFYFLDAGGSSDVFSSEDNQYVIKFFKAHRICPPKWVHWKFMQSLLPLSCKTIIQKKELQKELQFSSYKLSLESLKNQTGVVYLHLNPTTHHKNKIIFYDRIGVKHSVLADQTAFVLQKKAEQFAPHFKQLLLNKNDLEAYNLLSQFAFFLKQRAEKGIRDGDITPRYNLGIIGDSLVIFDIDQLRTTNLSDNKRVHMFKDGNEMFLWLKNKDPKFSAFLKKQIEQLSEEH